MMKVIKLIIIILLSCYLLSSCKTTATAYQDNYPFNTYYYGPSYDEYENPDEIGIGDPKHT